MAVTAGEVFTERFATRVHACLSRLTGNENPLVKAKE